MMILLGILKCSNCEACNKYNDTIYNISNYKLCINCTINIDTFNNKTNHILDENNIEYYQ